MDVLIGLKTISRHQSNCTLLYKIFCTKIRFFRKHPYLIIYKNEKASVYRHSYNLIWVKNVKLRKNQKYLTLYTLSLSLIMSNGDINESFRNCPNSGISCPPSKYIKRLMPLSMKTFFWLRMSIAQIPALRDPWHF